MPVIHPVADVVTRSMRVCARAAMPFVSLTLLAGTTAAAQTSVPPAPVVVADTLPFRPGQWAAVFAADRNLNTLGVQYFRSARTAWTFDYGLNAGSFRQEVVDDQERDDTHTGGTFRLGLRRHAVAHERAVRFFGGGVTASGGRTRSELSNGITTTNRSLAGGVFGELGAQYHATRYLALGAVGSVAAQFTDSRSKGTTPAEMDVRTRGWDATAGALRLFGVLLF